MPAKVTRTHDVVDRPNAQIRFGAGGTLTLKAYDDGTQIVPQTATISVKRPGGAPCTTPVAGAAVSIAGDGTMTYAISAGNADMLQGQFGAYAPWSAEWTVNYNAGAGNSTYIQLFDVVRWPIYNVVTTADLLIHRPDLASAYFTGETSAKSYIDQGFDDVYRKLSSLGNRPYLVIDSEQLRRPVEHAALQIFYEARVRSAGDRWEKYFIYHRDQFDRWFMGKTFTYDFDQSGTVDPSEVERQRGLGFKI
jgi:hypothetical protein